MRTKEWRISQKQTNKGYLINRIHTITVIKIRNIFIYLDALRKSKVTGKACVEHLPMH